MSNTKLDQMYIKVAENIATCSHAIRRKVGAVITKHGRIISTGYNGKPAGMSNECEYRVGGFDRSNPGGAEDWITFDEVIHAEANAILFAAKYGQKTDGCKLYITMSPCMECAKMIIQSGIIEVIYQEKYRDTSGIDLLKQANIKIWQIKTNAEI